MKVRERWVWVQNTRLKRKKRTKPSRRCRAHGTSWVLCGVLGPSPLQNPFPKAKQAPLPAKSLFPRHSEQGSRFAQGILPTRKQLLVLILP